MALAKGLTTATWDVSQDRISSDVVVGKRAPRNRFARLCTRCVEEPSTSPIVVGWSQAGNIEKRMMRPSRRPATPGNPRISRVDPTASLQSWNPEAVFTKKQTEAAVAALLSAGRTALT